MFFRDIRNVYFHSCRIKSAATAFPVPKLGNYRRTLQHKIAALRHGINHNGQPLVFMPSHEITLLSEQDMPALIACCEQVPKVDRTLPGNDFGPIAIIMSRFDKMPLFINT